jgi:Undecaprenyl-phosphate glucose phosphotransferase
VLKKHSKFFENLLLASDLGVISASWVSAFFLRFYYGPIPAAKGVPDFWVYAIFLLPIILIWPVVSKAFGLYRPKRISSRISEVFDITKACIVSVLILISLTFFVRQYEFSRLMFIYFTIIDIVLLSFSRAIFREILRFLRRRGYNQRFALIVGSGVSASGIIERIDSSPELGIKIEGYISADDDSRRDKLSGVSNIGTYAEIRALIMRREIDIVFIALSWDEQSYAMDILRNIGDEAVDIKVIPYLYEFITVGQGVEDFNGLPIMNLQSSRLYGWNIITKRVTDIVVASSALILFSPLLLAIAVLVKLSSPGPVFYRQKRMSIGGDIFEILKFRSMTVCAENKSGAVWARKDDLRRTRLGTVLRKTSLDELPQLFNVLKGEMSLVGPRPERPIFISEFRKEIPKYMLRHKMKAGITGWAQINGWRGDTNLDKRIEYDLYYIENWSLKLDLTILAKTISQGFINRNAY